MKKSAKERAKEMVQQMTLEEAASQTQYNSPAIEHLGIPEYNWWNEALHGVARAGTATSFPQAIGLAATFSPDLIKQAADIIATETRAKYNESIRHGDRGIYKGLTHWSPNINIFRDPRWGRGHETYGEDPFLTAQIGVAFVQGLQGDGPYLKTAACAKHFAVHSGPEALRHEFDAKANKEDMENTYLPAFRTLVKEGKVAGVMGAYNRVNGEACCASDVLQNYLKEWGFDGYFVSDCWAIRDIHEGHHLTETPAESAALALRHGCHLNCGNTYPHLLEALEQGLVTEKDIRRAAEKLLEIRIRLGQFDQTEYDDIPYTVVACENHRKFAVEIAKKSTVLLKNNGILPLKGTERIGLIGPNADNRTALIANYHGTPKRYITLLDALDERLPKDQLLYSSGCHLFRDRTENLAQADDRIAEALAVAENSNVIILCLGLDAKFEGEQGDASNAEAAGDRLSLSLPASQQRLYAAIMQLGKPIIIVSMSGSAINYSDAEQRADAILQAWYPGAEGGTAIAQLLYGEANPSGKLPVTFYRNDDDLPPFTDYSMQGRTYRYFKGTPLYPFGFGLSYTTFSYQKAEINDGTLSVTVRNTGKYDGEEVIQLYSQQSLVDFRRIHLSAGETVTVHFSVNDKMKGKILIGGCGYQPEKLLCVSLEK